MTAFVKTQYDTEILNNKKLIMLHEFALLLNSCYSIDEILRQSAGKIRHVTKSEGCHIVFYQLIKDNLNIETVYLDADTPIPPNVDLTKGKVIQETVQTEKPIIIEDTLYDPRIIQKAREHFGHRSMAAVPVIDRGETIGAIIVYSKYPANYSQSDGQFLMMLANHLGLAVENARLRLELEKAALVDSLTGAYNHRHLLSQLSTLAEPNIEKWISLIMVDVDDFKLINDSYGHLAGDYVLQEVTNIIKNAVRNDDILTRFGGDEFAIVLPGAYIDETKLIGSRIEKLVKRKEFKFGEDSFEVTISWGAVTVSSKDIKCINDFINLADMQLYETKNKKKNKSTS